MSRPETARRLVGPASAGDALLALALVVVAQVDVWAPDLAIWGDDPVPGSRPVNALLLLVAAGAVAWRRSTPLAAVGVAMSAIALQAVLSQDAPIGLLLVGPTLVLVYAVASHGTRAEAWAGLGITAVATAVHDLFDADLRSAADIDDASFWWLVVLAVWLAGRYTGSRRRAREAAEEARLREEAAAGAELRAVNAERLRIAGELHDMVAHSVSVVALQAGAALELLDRSPNRARDPLLAIERTARDALAEMRTLVGVLRTPEATTETEPLTAQPGLADLDDLAARVSDAGLPVEVVRSGRPRALSPGIELSAFRIAQEAVTNALRHATSPSRVRVELAYDTSELRLSVTDDGATAGTPTRGSGHGLVGMRERAQLYGGELDARPGPDGGFTVRARLPLGEADR